MFAASSLTEAFGEVEQAFERRFADIDVTVAFAGSQVLRLQIEQGANADLYASANEGHVRALAERGLVREALVFAATDLVVATPASDSTIRTFADLATAERIVIGTEGVPVGRYARAVLLNAERVMGTDFAEAVRSGIVSEETNARLVRAKVELGEADAALIYRTDALASDRVRIVEIPPEVNVAAEYWIAEIERDRSTQQSAARARAWIELLTGSVGARILAAHGFRAVESR